MATTVTGERLTSSGCLQLRLRAAAGGGGDKALAAHLPAPRALGTRPIATSPSCRAMRQPAGQRQGAEGSEHRPGQHGSAPSEPPDAYPRYTRDAETPEASRTLRAAPQRCSQGGDGVAVGPAHRLAAFTACGQSKGAVGGATSAPGTGRQLQGLRQPGGCTWPVPRRSAACTWQAIPPLVCLPPHMLVTESYLAANASTLQGQVRVAGSGEKQGTGKEGGGGEAPAAAGPRPFKGA